MISEAEILNLYAEVDKLVNQLLNKEKFWRKCHPCINNGKCCTDSETVAQFSEWVLIRRKIASLSSNEQQLLQDNIYHNRLCPFRTDDKCIIHDARPLVCRVTPYFVFADDDRMTHFYYPEGSCTKKETCSGRIYHAANNTHKIIKFKIPSKGEIYYCNGMRLRQLSTFVKLRKEESNTVLAWLQGFVGENRAC